MTPSSGIVFRVLKTESMKVGKGSICVCSFLDAKIGERQKQRGTAGEGDHRQSRGMRSFVLFEKQNKVGGLGRGGRCWNKSGRVSQGKRRRTKSPEEERTLNGDTEVDVAGREG